MLKIFPFILLFFWAFNAVGQIKPIPAYSNFKTGKAIDSNAFNKLTSYEAQLDSLFLAQHTNALKRMLEGEAFLPGTPQSLIDSAIEEQKALISIRYKENRSRYKFRNYKSGKLLDDQTKEMDSIGTACKCILYGDTIKISMGLLVFGGFTFSFNLINNRVASQYTVDEYKEKIYKLTDADSLNAVITIPISKQTLILNHMPTYKIGQQLMGYINFQTDDYLRANNYEEGIGKDLYTEKNMDKIHTQGIIRFTCKVRKKLSQDL